MPDVELPVVIDNVDMDGLALFNITIEGQSGYLTDPVNYDLSDDELRSIAAEAIGGGTVPGVNRQDVGADVFRNFKVERHASRPAEGNNPAVPNRIYLRPDATLG